MPACATQRTIADQSTIGNLFLPIPGIVSTDDGYASAKGSDSSVSRHQPRLNSERRTHLAEKTFSDRL